MRTYHYTVESYLTKIFFPHYRIDGKLQVLEILLEAIRYILIDSQGDPKKADKGDTEIILVIDKMSRLFFTSQNKVYSIAFPFSCEDLGGGRVRFTMSDQEIDALWISSLLSCIKDNNLFDISSSDFLDLLISYEGSSDKFWNIMQQLLVYEDGYIRYDYDQDGYSKARENKMEHHHPLNHYDLFYTSNATFKVGLDKRIMIEDFIDLLNIKTECKYLKKPS